MHKSSPAFSWRSSKERFNLVSGQVGGVIEALTTVWTAPKSFEDSVPYIIALVALDNGKKTTSQVVDIDAKIGDKVEPCLRRQYTDGESGIIEYGTKFRVIK